MLQPSQTLTQVLESGYLLAGNTLVEREYFSHCATYRQPHVSIYPTTDEQGRVIFGNYSTHITLCWLGSEFSKDSRKQLWKIHTYFRQRYNIYEQMAFVENCNLREAEAVARIYVGIGNSEVASLLLASVQYTIE